MFAQRNSLTLAIFWILLLIIGVFWYFQDAGKLVKAVAEEANYKELLTKSQNEIKRLTQVETIHEQLNEKWLNAPKLIISADEPSFTLSYINWIMTTYNLQIDFDFVLNQNLEAGDYTKFIYTLTGEGAYNDVYKLIWLLTYEPILYQINYFNLEKSTVNSDFIKFNFKLQGFTVESQTQINDDLTDFRPNSQHQLNYQKDIFTPLVKPKPVVVQKVAVEKPRLPAKLAGQIDVEKASLKAVTQSSIFITDGESGLIELKIGDPVYLGKLVKINQQTNQAEFIINKFGISQNVVLSIDQRN